MKMSLNNYILTIPKSKTINNFLSKYSKTNRVIRNYQKSIKEINKDFQKKEGVLDYLKSFLTPRRPSLIKQNLLFVKDKNNKTYLSTIQSKNEVRSPANLKSLSIFNEGKKVVFRNNNKNAIKQINSLKNKDNFRNIFYENNKCENYSNKLRGFSPKNRYKLMKIYQSLRCINSYCVTNTDKINKISKNNYDDFSNELNLDLSKDNYESNKSIKKEKNKITKMILKSNKKSDNIKEKKYNNKNKISEYKIESINSIQLLYSKKDDYYFKELKDKENSFKIEKIDDVFSINEKKDILKDDIKDIIKDDIKYDIKDDIKYDIKADIKEDIKEKINNNYIKELNQEKIILPDNNVKRDEKDENDKFVEEIINKIKNQDKIEEQENLNKYNKSRLMKNCLNKLFFDYSDGNYSGSNKYKYLNEEEQNKQNKNIILNKEIIFQKNENEEKDMNTVEKNGSINRQIINKENLNQILNNNQISNNNQLKIRDLIENKENINTENIKKDKDTILSIDDLNVDNKSNITNINKSSNKKLIEMISDKNQNKLKEMNKINFNLNYLYESQNFVNIQLLNDENRKNTNNPKKINSSLKNFYKHSKLTKNPEKKLELLLDKIPRHENDEDENNFANSNLSRKKNKNNNQNIRRSKIIEYINKNSAIMPPNDYTTTNQFISSF
mgnify:CR=1 FL=1